MLTIWHGKSRGLDVESSFYLRAIDPNYLYWKLLKMALEVDGVPASSLLTLAIV